MSERGARCLLLPLPAPLSPAPLQRRLALPWKPILTREELRRGISYYGSGRALDRVAAKLLAGKAIKAVALGGSVTAGGGSSHPSLNYVSLFFNFINETFPHRHAHEFAGTPHPQSARRAHMHAYSSLQPSSLFPLPHNAHT